MVGVRAPWIRSRYREFLRRSLRGRGRRATASDAGRVVPRQKHSVWHFLGLSLPTFTDYRFRGVSSSLSLASPRVSPVAAHNVSRPPSGVWPSNDRGPLDEARRHGPSGRCAHATPNPSLPARRQTALLCTMKCRGPMHPAATGVYPTARPHTPHRTASLACTRKVAAQAPRKFDASSGGRRGPRRHHAPRRSAETGPRLHESPLAPT